jgi:cytochrome d ubiquinol oxidase subunit I
MSAAVSLARWQFAITTVYHFFFVPLTLGLSIFVALLESKYVSSGDETYKKMTKFWGTLFLINFAMGVATGLVQEFQFGLNWSGYSRFMGDIFGAPLAIEALLAFYIESTFLGVWIFGWDKLPKKLHAAMIWLVAIGSNLSALWILIANSFMQEPVGYTLRHGRAEMTNFIAVATNPNVRFQWPHVFFGAVTTAGFFVLGFTAYHLLKNPKSEVFRKSFKWGAVYALIGVIMVILVGHFQGQHLVKHQPMKMAAAEAIWETEKPASFSLFATIDQAHQRNPLNITVPYFLSFLSYNNFTSEVKGIKDLQAEAEQKYGPGNYIPMVALTYWVFRIMVGAGFLMLLLALWAVAKGAADNKLLLKILVWAIFLPYIANSTGWIMAEVGRQPWIVYGLQKVSDAISPNVPAWNVAFSLIAFGLLYGVLMVADVYLLLKYGKQEPSEEGSASAAMAY